MSVQSERGPTSSLLPLPAGWRDTVLIVEDDPVALAELGHTLEHAHTVHAVHTGEEALVRAAEHPQPSLVLLDVCLPGIDGFEVLSRLHADPATAHIPVIFVTGAGASGDEARALRLGAVDYVGKPINPAVVRARVAVHLELRRHRIAWAHRSAELESEVQRRTRDIELVQRVALRALAGLGETRDSDTGLHVRRTQQYVQRLAEQLLSMGRHREALSARRLSLIVDAAALHDIGKIGIPDHILLKPGKLTPDEYDVMKTHVNIGVAVIDRAMGEVRAEADPDRSTAPGSGQDPLEFLRVVRVLVAGHHERWDGSGYPGGLAGEAIPLPARLMAVADVFDALVSRRVYKGATPMDEVVRTILDGRGTHFDPVLVSAFEACAEDLLAIARRLADPPVSVAIG